MSNFSIAFYGFLRSFDETPYDQFYAENSKMLRIIFGQELTFFAICDKIITKFSERGKHGGDFLETAVVFVLLSVLLGIRYRVVLYLLNIGGSFLYRAVLDLPFRGVHLEIFRPTSTDADGSALSVVHLDSTVTFLSLDRVATEKCRTV